MPNLYLLVGKKFNDNYDLNHINQQLRGHDLVADPVEEETYLRDKFTPNNIRKLSDPEGTQRYDFIRVRADSYCKLFVGRILQVGTPNRSSIDHQYFAPSADLESILDVADELSKVFSDVKVHAVHAYPEYVKRVKL